MKRILTVGAALAFTATVGLAPHFSSAQSAGQPWPTFHGDGYHNGNSTVSGPTAGNVKFRTFKLLATTHDSPVIASTGVAYIGDDLGNVYALDPTVSTFQVLFQSKGKPISATPTLSADGKTLYFPSADGNVYAINTADGSKKWTAAIGGPVNSSPLLSADGNTVYVIAAPSTIMALNASTGALTWKLHVDGTIAGNPTLGQNGSVLYMATSNRILFSIPATGAGAGQASTPYYLDGSALGSPAVDPSGNIYITTSIGSTLAFAPGNSTPKWTASVPNFTPSNSTPAISNGMVFVGNTNGYIYGINASTGTQQWQVPTGGAVNSSPAVAAGNNLVYAASEDGKVYAVTTSGTVSWSASIGVGADTSPALGADGSLWIAANDGTVYQFKDLTSPPPPPNTPVATATPTTPPATATPTASPTPTTIPLSLSGVKSKVSPGQKQTITVTSSPNTVVHLRVKYPNGDHQSHSVTTNGSGTATYSYTQGASKGTYNKHTAQIVAKVGSGSSANQATASYKINWGKVDVSAEPRSQKVGGTVQIYVHARKNVRVAATLLFPNHKQIRFTAKAGKNGFGHWHYKVQKGMTKGSNKTVTVKGNTTSLHPNYYSKTTFKIS